MQNNNVKLNIILALGMIICGVIGRFILVSYAGIPNLEIITSLALVAGIYLGGIYSIAVPLSILFLSDIVIGNNYIFIFTWTAFALIGIFGYGYGKKINGAHSNSHININSVYLAITCSVFFYLFTNFGWWLMSGMYEYSLSGLLRCYWMALPFFRNNLIGNLIFVPIVMLACSKIVRSLEFKNSIIVNTKGEVS